ncbi:hypothetical protein [Shewanella vaxholmensis]|uniref:Uncharacterized protein n=1 Tax=Shewanella vaxholmensis TaxID=3063535 RepID=A0ABU9UW72_9GAMM|nr:hypothetical protein [Shewanella sp. SP1S1-4]MDT3309302.1 hypothetical protein [Shewanella sp. SP1S1-4]
MSRLQAISIMLIGVSFSFCPSVNAAALSRSMTVITTLNKNAFFDGELNIQFKDERLYPVFDKKLKTLADTGTVLYVTSTLQDTIDNANVLHLLTLTQNSSICYEYDEAGESKPIPSDGSSYNYQSDLVSVLVDGQPLKAKEPLSLSFDSFDENGKSATHDFLLHFNELPVNANKCEGDVAVMVEFDI